MSKNIEILEKYTAGEITTAQANEQLDGVHLEKDKNVLTPDEVKSSFVGATPDMATGFGLLDTGTGTFDKVAVKDGVLETDCGESKALYTIAGRTYAVEGNKLVDVKPVVPGAPVPEHYPTGRNHDYAGTVQRYTDKRGVWDVTYDADGYVVKASKVKFN